MKRYEWSDALIDAQTEGRITNGALMLAMKLAKAINWNPKDGRPAGLYWKNEDALRAVGSSRAQWFKHRESLVETGFITIEKGNLVVTMPDESLVETEKSPVETKESLVETEKSPVDNPLSVDICSEDVLSVEDSETTAGAAVPVPSNSSLGEGVDIEPSLNLSVPTLPFNDGLKGFRKSLVETGLGMTEEQKARACAFNMAQRSKQLTPRIEDEW